MGNIWWYDLQLPVGLSSVAYILTESLPRKRKSCPGRCHCVHRARMQSRGRDRLSGRGDYLCYRVQYLLYPTFPDPWSGRQKPANNMGASTLLVSRYSSLWLSQLLHLPGSLFTGWQRPNHGCNWSEFRFIFTALQLTASRNPGRLHPSFH